MRRSKLYPLVALATLVPQVAHAQLKDTQWVRPAMMLLVDTSGSMERKPDVGSDVDKLPKCQNAAGDEKNRWAITLEALTGTFKNYRCTERTRASYNDFDKAYFLPHYEFVRMPNNFDPTPLRGQNDDGLLDSYLTRLKFGVMTFDGVSTTVNGATLVPFADFGSVKSDINGLLGQYSYPLNDIAEPKQSYATDDDRLEALTPNNAFGWKPLSFPGCPAYYGVNAGARAEGNGSDGEPLPGSLIPVGKNDDQASVATVNQRIQNSLLQVRPYAGTPIAAMLDDLRYYLRNSPDINSTDPFFECRDRYAVLLTDGAPDSMFRGGSFQCDTTNDADRATCAKYKTASSASCQCPYDTEKSLAGKLLKDDKLSKLWVVAFNVNDASALAALDAIAAQGGTTEAQRSNDLDELRAKLDKIFAGAEPEATSRSVPVVINTGRAVMLAGGKQFRISAGFKINSTADTPWEGRLWRQRVECENGAPAERELAYDKGDIFHEKLNATSASSRTLYTVLPAAAKTDGTVLNRNETNFISSAKEVNELKPNGDTFGEIDETDISADQSQEDAQSTVAKVSSTPATFDGSISRNYFGSTNAMRDKIYAFVSGATGTYREKHKLGDIYHSNPAVLPPLFPGSDLLSTYDPTLRAFYTDLLDATKTTGYAGHYDGAVGRPGAVFVATNDGLLHAFNLDDWKSQAGTTVDGGAEFWAMMPPATFGMMSSVVAPTHQLAFDGSPVVKDVILNRNTGTGATKVSTVLLIALRGLPAYMALDVSWPEEPKFLWQRSFKYLGKTVGTPMLANVRITWNNIEQIRAVAILPGGDGFTNGNKCAVDAYGRGKAPNTGARDNVRCWGHRGRELYVVDVETGELIQEFDHRHFPSAVTGSVAVDGEELSVSRAAYFTDADGVLYRLSMGNTDPAKWRVVPIWDVFGGQAVNFSGTPVEVTGHGSGDSWKAGRAASYPPVIDRDPTTGNLTIVVGTGDVDDLANPIANRVVSINESRAYDGTEIYSSAAPSAYWNLQLDAGESVTGPMAVLNDTLYFTSFTGPGNTNNKCTLGTSRIVGASLRNFDSNKLPVGALAGTPPGTYRLQYQPDGATGASLLLGLSIAREPICFQGTASTDPINATLPGRMPASTPGGGAYQMRALVAGEGGEVMSGSDKSDNGQRMFSNKLNVGTTVRSVGWASSVE
jgi:type IV pilus assembly protein PilY1